MPEPTSRQRRILESMEQGNAIWEVSGEEHCAVYDEKIKRDRIVRQNEIERMEQVGWIRKAANTSRNRLDSWQLTEEGRAIATPVKRRTKRSIV
jgi:hypothetical protein